VTGNTAGVVDYLGFFDSWMPFALAVVLSLSFILLLVAFRSVVIPAQAIAMNLLSVGAAYGLMVLVFQKGVGAGLLGIAKVDAIEAWVPLFLFSLKAVIITAPSGVVADEPCRRFQLRVLVHAPCSRGQLEAPSYRVKRGSSPPISSSISALSFWFMAAKSSSL
jgi:hypothetical protein